MWWPVGDPAFANDVVAGHCPALMRVGAVVAIVAENKVIASHDFLMGIRILRRFPDIGLCQGGVVDEHRAVLDFYGVAGHGDDSLDKVGVGVMWGTKNNYLAALRGMKEIGGFADHNVFAGSDGGQHGRAVYLEACHRDLEESGDGQSCQQRYNEIANEFHRSVTIDASP